MGILATSKEVRIGRVRAIHDKKMKGKQMQRLHCSGQNVETKPKYGSNIYPCNPDIANVPYIRTLIEALSFHFVLHLVLRYSDSNVC